MYEDFQEHLKQHKPHLTGLWVESNAGYEADICAALEVSQQRSRYWDAVWGDYRLEFKKGRSIWLDLVRYSEVLLGQSPPFPGHDLCLFFIPNKDRSAIQEVITVTSASLLAKLAISQRDAEFLIDLHKRVPRSLNAQASLTVMDVKGIAAFVV